jgi:hypothetical protein
LRTPGFAACLKTFARCVAEQRGGNLLDIEEVDLEVLDLERAPSMQHLRQLEALHSQLTLYLWLSYRFPGVFRDRPMAFQARSMTERKISDVLIAMSMDEKNEVRRRERIRKLKERQEKQDALIARLRKQLIGEAAEGQVGAAVTLDEHGSDSAACLVNDDIPDQEREGLEANGPTPSPLSTSNPSLAGAGIITTDLEVQEKPPTL